MNSAYVLLSLGVDVAVEVRNKFLLDKRDSLLLLHDASAQNNALVSSTLYVERALQGRQPQLPHLVFFGKSSTAGSPQPLLNSRT